MLKGLLPADHETGNSSLENIWETCEKRSPKKRNAPERTQVFGQDNSDDESEANPAFDLVSEDPTTPRQDRQAEESRHLGPPKIASYGKVGDTGVLHGQGIVRVESVQGIIEHASGQTTPMSPTSSQHNVELLQPVSYSPNDYGGVWENDPAVVSVPTFLRAE